MPWFIDCMSQLFGSASSTDISPDDPDMRVIPMIIEDVVFPRLSGMSYLSIPSDTNCSYVCLPVFSMAYNYLSGDCIHYSSFGYLGTDVGSADPAFDLLSTRYIYGFPFHCFDQKAGSGTVYGILFPSDPREPTVLVCPQDLFRAIVQRLIKTIEDDVFLPVYSQRYCVYFLAALLFYVIWSSEPEYLYRIIETDKEANSFLSDQFQAAFKVGSSVSNFTFPAFNLIMFPPFCCSCFATFFSFTRFCPMPHWLSCRWNDC